VFRRSRGVGGDGCSGTCAAEVGVIPSHSSAVVVLAALLFVKGLAGGDGRQFGCSARHVPRALSNGRRSLCLSYAAGCEVLVLCTRWMPGSEGFGRVSLSLAWKLQIPSKRDDAMRTHDFFSHVEFLFKAADLLPRPCHPWNCLVSWLPWLRRCVCVPTPSLPSRSRGRFWDSFVATSARGQLQRDKMAVG
jgi:hypothetical protein